MSRGSTLPGDCDAEGWAIPLRAADTQLVQDLHPSDRCLRGTHHGAIIANGNLYWSGIV